MASTPCPRLRGRQPTFEDFYNALADLAENYMRRSCHSALQALQRFYLAVEKSYFGFLSIAERFVGFLFSVLDDIRRTYPPIQGEILPEHYINKVVDPRRENGIEAQALPRHDAELEPVHNTRGKGCTELSNIERNQKLPLLFVHHQKRSPGAIRAVQEGDSILSAFHRKRATRLRPTLFFAECEGTNKARSRALLKENLRFALQDYVLPVFIPDIHIRANDKNPYFDIQGKLFKFPHRPASTRLTESVIFIHGLASSSNFWRDTIFRELSPQFLATYDIFAPDLLGLGQSPQPRHASYSIEEQADAVSESVILRNRLRSFHLVGHSMGCMIALEIAARYPGLVRSITLLAPANWELGDKCLLDEMGAPRLWPIRNAALGTLCNHANITRLLSQVFKFPGLIKGILRETLPAKYPDSFIQDFLLANKSYHTLWSMWSNALRVHRIRPAVLALEKAGVHIRIIHGMEDPLCPFSCSEYLAEHHSNVSLCGIPGAGHELVLAREAAIAWEIEKEIWSDR